MFPREHGAWSLLLTPFVASLLIAGAVNWTVLAALGAALAAFLLRAPLIALARQRWVWKDVRPESAEARQWLPGLILALAATGAVLLRQWGFAVTVPMGVAVLALTAAAVWMSVRNRQRSPWFQVVSSAGLAFSSVAAARAASGDFPDWAWILWGLCALQGAAGILSVHARLDASIARKKNAPSPGRPMAAWMAVAVSALAGVACLAWNPLAGAAPLLGATVQGLDLRKMNLDLPLKSVGLRAMTLSMAHALILVAALRLVR
jgi:hypothetical protein